MLIAVADPVRIVKPISVTVLPISASNKHLSLARPMQIAPAALVVTVVVAVTVKANASPLEIAPQKPKRQIVPRVRFVMTVWNAYQSRPVSTAVSFAKRVRFVTSKRVSVSLLPTVRPMQTVDRMKYVIQLPVNARPRDLAQPVVLRAGVKHVRAPSVAALAAILALKD